ncbi:CheY-like protein [Alteromonas phage vB_AemP_PT15-A5]|nr:CheY-like protein [Alteromonas phage vB_AemP_PT15-A5]
MKAFIVDDAPIILSIIAFMLDKEGIDSHYSTEVNDALYDEIAEYAPDVIILDLYLKSHDGVAVAKRIHEIEDLKNTPIIAISHSHDLFSRVMLNSKDFANYLEKPVVKEKLLPLVNTYGSIGKILNVGKQLLKGNTDDSDTKPDSKT